ncbi:Rhodanese-like protein [Niveomyces insectorum RCEF 264]|uniref:Rhodanese-like protein n=1 Tax=Niveomyces insectorum RCEF 264 TaxID=1081102 RepID=A0A162MDX4_9HYPO|nr:Rhodanese-like protein [Niveomyces insectorum RCEF 264]
MSLTTYRQAAPAAAAMLRTTTKSASLTFSSSAAAVGVALRPLGGFAHTAATRTAAATRCAFSTAPQTTPRPCSRLITRSRSHTNIGAARLSPAAGLLSPFRRAYSSSEQPPPSKIWSFEDVQQLTKSTNAPVVLVDTREPHELQETGRIPGAINIPVSTAPDGFFLPDEEFEDRFGFARPGRDTEVVFYCKAGVRSRAAAGLAKEAGWTKVGEYPGSWLDWAGKGGAVER